MMGLAAALLDISTGGCCLKLQGFDVPAGLAPGSLLSSIKLLHPTFDGTPITGRIAWRKDQPPHALLGVQFLDMRPITLQSVQSFVKSHLSRSLDERDPST
jgi:c-di-GMP-binding flagellar brake protein YcgR